MHAWLCCVTVKASGTPGTCLPAGVNAPQTPRHWALVKHLDGLPVSVKVFWRVPPRPLEGGPIENPIPWPDTGYR
jgi:hypothetical protein